MKSNKLFIIITGAIIGVIAVLLVKFGNPANMGFCIACFIRDTAGALKLHSAAIVQYMRPEIIGLVLGASIMAFSKKELIGAKLSVEEIRKEINADTLQYLTIEDMLEALGNNNYCIGCFSGEYPTEIPKKVSSNKVC